MKAIVITPKTPSEFKFISDLLKKLGVGSASLNDNELEDIGISKMMQGMDKTSKVKRAEIMQKLSS